MSTAVSHKYRVAGHSVQTIPHTSSGVGVSNPVVVSEIRQCPIAVVRGSSVRSFVNVVGGAAVVVRTVEVCDDRRTVLAIANLEGSAPRRAIVIRIGADSIAWIRRQVVDPSFWRVTARVAGRAGLKVFVPGEYGSGSSQHIGAFLQQTAAREETTQTSPARLKNGCVGSLSERTVEPSTYRVRCSAAPPPRELGAYHHAGSTSAHPAEDADVPCQ